MATRRRMVNEPSDSTPQRHRPATTPEAREQQLVALAYDLAERKMREGTASSQEVVHFLKLGSTRERLEQERLEIENSLNKTKIEMMASQKNIEKLYGQALNAMRSYSGQDPVDLGEGDED